MSSDFPRLDNNSRRGKRSIRRIPWEMCRSLPAICLRNSIGRAFCPANFSWMTNVCSGASTENQIQAELPVSQARTGARERLPSNASNLNSHDPSALYALTLTTGKEADYLGILEKRHLDSLRMIKQAEGYARQLLMAQPDAQDAWLALGAADYIISSLPAQKKVPKMLLALASLREGQNDTARATFYDLSNDFPNNSLFSMELARLDKSRAQAPQTAE